MFELKSNKLKWGLILISIGAVVWARNYGLLSFPFSFSKDWPIILVTLGLVGIWKSVSFKNNSKKIPSKEKKRVIGDILKDVETGDKSAEDAIKELDSQKYG